MRTTRSLLPVIIIALLFVACTANRQRYERVLQRAHEQNQADDSIVNVDSILKAVNYMDRHGSANERMRAHYLLGCAYRDMGDAPRALECFHDAISQADTTNRHCNLKQLYRVYGQMALLMYMQNMPNQVVSAYRKAYEIALSAKDTIPAYIAFYHQADAYDLMEKYDSVKSICHHAYKLFESINRRDLAASSLFMLIFADLNTHDYSSAKRHLTEYENYSGIKEHKEEYWNEGMLYNAKGLYSLGVGDLEHAEINFRRELAVSSDVDNKHAAFQGLQEVFQKRNVSDSTAKYAVLSAHYNDSVYKLMNTSHLQQVEASYNYNRHKDEAKMMKEKAERIRQNMLVLFSIFLVVVLCSIWFLFNQRKNKKEEIIRLNLKIDSSLLRLEQAQSDLRLLSEKHNVDSKLISEKNRVIESLQQEIALMSEKIKVSNSGTIEEELMSSDILFRFRALVEKNQNPNYDDWRKLRTLFNRVHPHFYTSLNKNNQMSQSEYDMCLLIRLRFKPAEIAALMNCDRSTVTVTRSRMLKKYLSKEGKAKDFDDYLFSIV